jgi:ABC-type Zn2+ transport system substrate-binding protein/surface adhesin
MLDDLYASSSILWTLLHGSRQARISAATVLGRLGKEFAIPYLEKALDYKAKSLDARYEARTYQKLYREAKQQLENYRQQQEREIDDDDDKDEDEEEHERDHDRDDDDDDDDDDDEDRD